jgi:Fe-S cluster assembly protein SufD
MAFKSVYFTAFVHVALLALCAGLMPSMKTKFRRTPSIASLRAAVKTKQTQDNVLYENEDKPIITMPTKAVIGDVFKNLRAELGTGPLQRLHEQGTYLLDNVELPRGKAEAWRHTNMAKLFPRVYQKVSPTTVTSQDVAPWIDEECKKSCLVFVDGKLDMSLSNTENVPEEITFKSILDVKDTAAQERMLTECSFIPDLEELPRNSYASDVLSGLNMANIEDVATIIVPDNVRVEVPLQVLFYSSKQADGKFPVTFPKLAMEVGAFASLRMKQSYAGGSNLEEPLLVPEGDDQASLVLAATRAFLDTNATLDHTYFQELPCSARIVEVLSVEQSEHTTYEMDCLQSGAKLGRINAHVNLNGEGSNVTLSAVTLAHERQTLDMRSSILHDTPGAFSTQVQRNVIGDKGEAVFKGRIRMPAIAQETVSDQICRSLMLGDRARVIAMPTLEVTADNVECSHGASVADLDENEMFYMSARGISRKIARSLLLRNFVLEPLANAVKDEAGQKRILEKVDLMNPVADIASFGDSGQSMISI